MSVFHCIEVTAYWADEDTYRALHLIGPYPTAAARDRDLRRLANLPGNHGDAEFTYSGKDPATADYHCTPDKVAGIKHFNQVVGALYGYGVDDNGEDVEPVPVMPGTAALFDLAGGAA